MSELKNELDLTNIDTALEYVNMLISETSYYVYIPGFTYTYDGPITVESIEVLVSYAGKLVDIYPCKLDTLRDNYTPYKSLKFDRSNNFTSPDPASLNKDYPCYINSGNILVADENSFGDYFENGTHNLTRVLVDNKVPDYYDNNENLKFGICWFEAFSLKGLYTITCTFYAEDDMALGTQSWVYNPVVKDMVFDAVITYDELLVKPQYWDAVNHAYYDLYNNVKEEFKPLTKNDLDLGVDAAKLNIYPLIEYYEDKPDDEYGHIGYLRCPTILDREKQSRWVIAISTKSVDHILAGRPGASYFNWRTLMEELLKDDGFTTKDLKNGKRHLRNINDLKNILSRNNSNYPGFMWVKIDEVERIHGIWCVLGDVDSSSTDDQQENALELPIYLDANERVWLYYLYNNISNTLPVYLMKLRNLVADIASRLDHLGFASVLEDGGDNHRRLNINYQILDNENFSYLFNNTNHYIKFDYTKDSSYLYDGCHAVNEGLFSKTLNVEFIGEKNHTNIFNGSFNFVSNEPPIGGVIITDYDKYIGEADISGGLDLRFPISSGDDKHKNNNRLHFKIDTTFPNSTFPVFIPNINILVNREDSNLKFDASDYSIIPQFEIKNSKGSVGYIGDIVTQSNVDTTNLLELTDAQKIKLVHTTSSIEEEILLPDDNFTYIIKPLNSIALASNKFYILNINYTKPKIDTITVEFSYDTDSIASSTLTNDMILLHGGHYIKSIKITQSASNEDNDTYIKNVGIFELTVELASTLKTAVEENSDLIVTLLDPNSGLTITDAYSRIVRPAVFCYTEIGKSCLKKDYTFTWLPKEAYLTCVGLYTLDNNGKLIRSNARGWGSYNKCWNDLLTGQNVRIENETI